VSRARGTIAFGASIAIHALVLGLRFHGPTVERVAGSVPRLLAIETVPATRVLDIIPVTRDPATERASVRERDEPATVAPAFTP
jgi:hypothetical protein